MSTIVTELEFDIVHRDGIKHQAADALARPTTSGTDRAALDDNLPVPVPTPKMSAHRWKPREYSEKDDATNEQTADTTVPFLPKVFAPAKKAR